MSVPEDIDPNFYHDKTDDTFGLELWFDRDDYEQFIALCRARDISPHRLVWEGIQVAIQAMTSPMEAIIIRGIPSPN